MVVASECMNKFKRCIDGCVVMPCDAAHLPSDSPWFLHEFPPCARLAGRSSGAVTASAHGGDAPGAWQPPPLPPHNPQQGATKAAGGLAHTHTHTTTSSST